MAEIIKRGSDEPIQQFWETGWSRENGGTFNTEFKGINLNKVSALANYYAALGYKGNLRYQGGVATLVLSADWTNIPGGNSPFTDITDRWEVGVDQEKPDLLVNENFLSLAQAADNEAITGKNLKSIQIAAAIKASANKPVLINSSGEEVEDRGVTPWQSFYSRMRYSKLRDSNGEPIDSITLGASINLLGAHPNIADFAMDYFEGRTNFLRGKYVLRHHTNAPSNYTANVADFNVEKIYTIAQLLTECQSTTLWILPLPAYLSYKIQNYPVPVYMRPNYMWGGLKTRSTAATAARGRVEIMTEYLIDAWPIHTYGTVA